MRLFHGQHGPFFPRMNRYTKIKTWHQTNPSNDSRVNFMFYGLLNNCSLWISAFSVEGGDVPRAGVLRPLCSSFPRYCTILVQHDMHSSQGLSDSGVSLQKKKEKKRGAKMKSTSVTRNWMRILWLFLNLKTWFALFFPFSNHLCIDRWSFFLLAVRFFTIGIFSKLVCWAPLWEYDGVMPFCWSPAGSALLCKEMYKMLIRIMNNKKCIMTSYIWLICRA